jgi:hypothetical protein
LSGALIRVPSKAIVETVPLQDMVTRGVSALAKYVGYVYWLGSERRRPVLLARIVAIMADDRASTGALDGIGVFHGESAVYGR